MPDRPAPFAVRHLGGTTAVAWRTEPLMVAGNFIFTAAVGAFLALAYSRMWGRMDAKDFVLMIALGGGLLASGYLALTQVFNETSLSIDAERLTVSHAPLPWPGVEIPRSELAGVHARIEPRGISFRLFVDRRGGRATLLAARLSEDRARALAKFLSEQLGVPELDDRGRSKE